MLREYIVSEAMHALGIPTTRSLAVVTTGEAVYRESPLGRGADARRGQPHPRRHDPVGRGAPGGEALRALADYTIARHYPELATAPEPYLALFDASSNARPPARPMAARRLHPRRDEHRQHGGVRRDDRLRSMRVHGPLRSGHSVQLDRSTAATPTRTSRRSRSGISPGWPRQWCRCSTRRRSGRRARHGAPRSFPAMFERHWLDGMREKLGLFTAEEGDKALVDDCSTGCRRGRPTSPTRSCR